ncbi:PAS domain-containing protein [Roseovarius sp.]|uniref:PAS domain-containing protein n=1 Tax=Roseovarius sp. TaxID=1486281 RepID=UPI00257FE002|nr:PAS domain-containing protein [Roseovarius sp.]|tara:strand:+ start:2138 stop:2923 length:786 start_codon:yes stop_codon:yes gene_type:complete
MQDDRHDTPRDDEGERFDGADRRASSGATSDRPQPFSGLTRLLRRATDEDAALDAICDYWHGLRRGHTVPRRADLDPRGFSDHVSSVFVLEKIAPGLARFRIAGQQVSEVMGMDLRGMPLSALIQLGSRDALQADLVRLFEEPAILRMRLRSGARLTGAMLLLPLRSDLGDVSRALGILRTRGPVGSGVNRFGITSSSIQSIGQAQGLPPGYPLPTASPTASPTAHPAPQPGFAERQLDFLAPGPDAPHHPSERPYLRLVR